MMASKATSLWRSTYSSGIKGNRSFSTSKTPKLRSFFAPVTDYLRTHGEESRGKKGAFVPVYVALGMILAASSFGAYMGLLHLMYEPSVRVNKKKRETLPEVYMPDEVAHEAKQFVTKSFFRKLAHIQEIDTDHSVSDPIRGDVFAHPEKALKAETLKTAGVEPTPVYR